MTMKEYLESLTEIHVKCDPIDLKNLKNIWKDSVLLTSTSSCSHRHEFTIPEDMVTWWESQVSIDPEILKYYMPAQLSQCLTDIREVL